MPQPAGVTLNDAKIKELISIYKRATLRITQDINNASTFDKIRRTQLLSQVRQIVGELGQDIDAWADENITAYYREGFLEAQKELKKAGVNIKETAVFSTIDEQAVLAIVDEVKLGFAESMRGVIRGVQNVLREADKLEINAQLAEGIVTGETQKKIAQQVKGTLQERGITSLVDKSGRRWELDVYTNMLVRTKAVEARNSGLGNTMAQYGFDLVQVSDHNSDHPECSFWESKILSYTGKTPKGTKLAGGYVVAGSFAEAKAAGLFHPNCKHAINVFNAELAATTKAYDNPFNVNSKDRAIIERELTTATTRPPQQVAIEQALNSKNFKEAQRIIGELPANDPYRLSMQSLIDASAPATAPRSLGTVSLYRGRPTALEGGQSFTTDKEFAKAFAHYRASTRGMERADITIDALQLSPKAKVADLTDLPSTLFRPSVSGSMPFLDKENAIAWAKKNNFDALDIRKWDEELQKLYPDSAAEREIVVFNKKMLKRL